MQDRGAISEREAIDHMQYHGGYERMIRDVQRFLRENDVVRFVRDKAVPFFQRKGGLSSAPCQRAMA